MLEIASKAPNFKLKNQDDIEIALSDFIGGWVVVYFYPKDDTPGCTKEACGFSETYESFKGLGATILGISPDSVKKHQKFIEKYKLNITLLCDEDKQTLKDYHSWGIKKMYGKEYEGVIRNTFLIDPKGEIAFIWQKIRVDGHIEAVREKLIALQNEEV